MYPYGNANGDSVVPFDISERKCFKIDIPDGGMQFFNERHTKLHVSCGIIVLRYIHPFALVVSNIMKLP